MAYWVFMDYVSPTGTNQIKKWANKNLTFQSRFDLEALLKMLAKQRQWGYPDFKVLSGKHSGFGEVRFKSKQGTPLRVIGMKGEAADQYILLIGCSHKETYDPPNALDTAIQRKKELANKTGTICEHEEND